MQQEKKKNISREALKAVMSSSHRTLLFVGDSLIEFFDWQSRFNSDTVQNYGRAGESVQELLLRATHLATMRPSPDHILIMIGTNNIIMEDFSFVPAYEQIIDTLQNGHPNSSITLNSLFPCQLPWLAPHTIPQVNSLLEGLARAKKIGYLDGYRLFSSTNGAHPPFFLEDGVHLSDYGYIVWSQAVAEHLSSLHDTKQQPSDNM